MLGKLKMSNRCIAKFSTVFVWSKSSEKNFFSKISYISFNVNNFIVYTLNIDSTSYIVKYNTSAEEDQKTDLK